jgi:poly-gamma-glutamate synthesis protein (capsule biosynthesis protein)
MWSPEAGPASQPVFTPSENPTPRSDIVTLFLCGDVMTGRGIDQVLPHPSHPQLYESHVSSAVDYVTLAENANGPIPKPVPFSYVWGDALVELARRQPAVRVINLETAVTTNDDHEPKVINYRMNPRNFPCITVAGIDCCVLANNHVLDWGQRGLLETLDAIKGAGVKTAGAGRTSSEAEAPAVVPVAGGRRVIVLAFGVTTSGISHRWAATARRPGVNLLRNLDAEAIGQVARRVTAIRKPGDIVVASIHWGSNWGYDIPRDQLTFAHGLIDEANVDVVHGHSSHHAKAIEVYSDKLVLYGCGDFLNDYEGIGGYDAYRNDLAVMYFAGIDGRRGTLAELTMVPLRIRNFRLNRAATADVVWLGETLTREGARFKTHAIPSTDGALKLAWR